jgi:hypothetical protein
VLIEQVLRRHRSGLSIGAALRREALVLFATAAEDTVNLLLVLLIPGQYGLDDLYGKVGESSTMRSMSPS